MFPVGTEAAPPTAGGLKAPGKVVALFLSRGSRRERTPVETVTAITGSGLAGDRHARPGSTRQVLLMDEAVLGDLGLAPGDVRENVTLSGIDLHGLSAGTRLRIGTALLEITAPCEPCRRMEAIREGLAAELVGRRGMLARVLEGGEIALGSSAREE